MEMGSVFISRNLYMVKQWQKEMGRKPDEVFIIAEIGKNFIQTQEERPVSEYLENAKELIRAAHTAGADAVKFQTHEVEDEQLPLDVTSPHFTGSDRYSWVTRNTHATPLHEFWEPLKAYCDEIGIIFFSTPMSRKAANKLAQLDVPLWKVGSGDVQDYALLDKIAETPKPVIISSGMVSLAELDRVVAHIETCALPLAVLYCISHYPAPKEYFNLATITNLTERYPAATIGFSDHSLGDEISRAAIVCGARILEKHFSFSRDHWGADHKVSMTPDEFGNMVARIRSGDLIDPAPYLGDIHKELEGAHNTFRPYFNKTLVAGQDIAEGDLLTRENVYAMRPAIAGELPAAQYLDVLGKKTSRSLKKYEPIVQGDIV